MIQFLLKLLSTEVSCCASPFPLILAAKFHSLYIKESEILERSDSGVGNFGKVGVGVGYFISDSATLVDTQKKLSTPCNIGYHKKRVTPRVPFEHDFH